MQVEDPAQYSYFPSVLLKDMAELLARVSSAAAVVSAVAEDPDYDVGVMKAARDSLSKDQGVDYEIVARLDRMMAQVR